MSFARLPLPDGCVAGCSFPGVPACVPRCACLACRNERLDLKANAALRAKRRAKNKAAAKSRARNRR